MSRIFCILGKSGSGKDTIYKRLLEDLDDSLDKVVLYTTRPMRSTEKDGDEYHFVSEEDFRLLSEQGKIVEERTYNTIHGPWRYFTSRDSLISETGKNLLIIGVLESFTAIKASFKESEIVPLYIELDDGIRLERALKRERAQENPKYTEMCRRFLADQEDFSEDKILAAGIDKRFKNEDLETCISEIKEFIDGYKD